MAPLIRLLAQLFTILTHLLGLLLRTIARVGRYWASDMQRRTTTTGKMASFSVGVFAMLCACAFPLALLRPAQGAAPAQARAHPTTQAAPTASAAMVAASRPASRDVVVTRAKLRAEPSALVPSIGILCPGDRLTYLEQHQAAIFRYFRVRVRATGPDCEEQHVRAGEEVG